MSKKTGITLIVIVTALVLTITLAVSYAYWSVTKKGTTRNIVTSGCFNFEISKENNEINLDNAYPIADSEVNELVPYTFTVTNTCTIYASYEVNLEMLGTSTLNSSLIAIKVNDENKKILGTLSARDTQDTTSKEARLIASGGLEPNESAKYDLRVWLDEHVTLEDDAENKIFRGKVVVVGTASGETELSEEEKTITLYIDDQEVTQTTRLNVLKYDIEVPNENWTNIGASKGATVSYNNGTILLNKIADGTKVFLNDSVKTTIDNTDNTETNIVMLKDEEVNETIQINNGKTITLDLNGKTIKTDVDEVYIFRNYGTLNLKSSADGGNMTSIRGVVDTKGTLNVYSGSYINLKSANDGGATFVNTNNGTLNIYGEEATFTNDNKYINGTYIKGSGNSAINNLGGVVNVYSGLMEVTKNISVVRANYTTTNKIEINIYGGKIVSEYENLGLGPNCGENSFINVYGGLFISKNSYTIRNDSSGKINITQTTKPIYITSLAQLWRPPIYNSSTGTISIIANEANKCTNNNKETTSGLCVYAEGIGSNDVINNTSANNSALQNTGNGIVTINGGTYFGGNQGINNSNKGTINILSANIISKKIGVLNNRSGKINICNAKINGNYDLLNPDVDSEGVGTINYSSSVIFTNGTNTPVTGGGLTANIIPNYTGTCTAE